ncbi:Hypothetical_protein [Hexamita inflata]|uniref:Hypothetical_protein n=1 Tax=Hexamita inflata TaxID=28002 RepID=A0AA86QVL8_9EUKA|nr:Hypothetical protein HINF_LOCUS51657 [Hexamita inflata]
MIIYAVIIFRVRLIQIPYVKLFVYIVIYAHILLFSTQFYVWKNCQESIYVRMFGQLGFLTSYLWSRLLQMSLFSHLDPNLRRALKYPELIIVTAYLIRVSKYVLMLGKISMN